MRCTDAAGFRAAAALENYEEQLARLCRARADPEGAGLLQRELRQVCTCCLPLPQVSGATLALLLSHHRFLADLVRGGGDIAHEATARSLRSLQHSVHLLKRECRELFIAPHLH